MFLLTTKRRYKKIVDEFPELSSLEIYELSDSPDLEALDIAMLKAFSGERAIVFPFPLRPSTDLRVLSSQAAFALATESLIISVYPRPNRVAAIAKEPFILGDLLISPRYLREFLRKTVI